MQNEKLELVWKFSIGSYFQTLTMLLREPRRFFSQLPLDTGVKAPLSFLLCSCLFSTVAGLVGNMTPNTILWGGIFFINALGMTLIAAILGYILMVMFMGKRVTFSRLFSIYAFSSGVTLLASWVPFFFWLTEPWKWWLVAMGMVHGFGLRWVHAVLIISISIVIIILFFFSAMPFLLQRA